MEQNSPKFLLEIMTLVSSANNTGSERIFFFSGGGHLCILRTIKVPELSLRDLLVSLYPSQRKKYELH
jgi:hypothetical protein